MVGDWIGMMEDDEDRRSLTRRKKICLMSLLLCFLVGGGGLRVVGLWKRVFYTLDVSWDGMGWW